MKIGYDGKRAVRNLTGLGNYSRLIIDNMAEAYPADHLLVYTPDMRENPRLETIKARPNVEFRFPAPQGLKGSLWRTFGITNNLKADGVDIFHGLSNELPLNIRSTGIPSVVTVHDVIYRRLPDCYKPFDRLLYDYKYGRSCRNADHIIAVSERTRQDIIEFYNIPPDKITVIYQGCDSQFRKPVSEGDKAEIRNRYHLPERYMIQVGTIEKRKNLGLSVKALNGISPDISLVVVGRDHHGYKKEVERIATEEGVTRRIIWLEGVPFKDLPGLYSGAEVVLYPSRYEGFGIPVLEALECGCPVVAATGSCLEEAGGPDTLYINPDDPNDMIQAVHAILRDPASARLMAEAGRQYARRFRSENMAPKIHALYESLIENRDKNKTV